MIADYEFVPLARAHILVGVSRATVYRWYDTGRLDAEDIGDLGKGMKLHVRAGDVRALHGRLHPLRHAGEGPPVE